MKRKLFKAGLVGGVAAFIAAGLPGALSDAGAVALPLDPQSDWLLVALVAGSGLLFAGLVFASAAGLVGPQRKYGRAGAPRHDRQHPVGGHGRPVRTSRADTARRRRRHARGMAARFDALERYLAEVRGSRR